MIYNLLALKHLCVDLHHHIALSCVQFQHSSVVTFVHLNSCTWSSTPHHFILTFRCNDLSAFIHLCFVISEPIHISGTVEINISDCVQIKARVVLLSKICFSCWTQEQLLLIKLQSRLPSQHAVGNSYSIINTLTASYEAHTLL